MPRPAGLGVTTGHSGLTPAYPDLHTGRHLRFIRGCADGGGGK